MGPLLCYVLYAYMNECLEKKQNMKCTLNVRYMDGSWIISLWIINCSLSSIGLYLYAQSEHFHVKLFGTL